MKPITSSLAARPSPVITARSNAGAPVRQMAAKPQASTASTIACAADFRVFREPGHHHYQQRRPQRRFKRLAARRLISIRCTRQQRGLQQFAEHFPPLTLDREKAPGAQPGVIGNAQGGAKNLCHLRRRWRGVSQFWRGVALLQKTQDIVHEAVLLANVRRNHTSIFAPSCTRSLLCSVHPGHKDVHKAPVLRHLLPVVTPHRQFLGGTGVEAVFNMIHDPHRLLELRQ